MNKNIISSNEYDFLKEGKFKDENEICILTVGSIDTYGLDGSKVPLRGVCVNSYKSKLYLNSRYNTVIYNLNQFKENLINCNPLALEILGCKYENIIKITYVGKKIRDNTDMFLNSHNAIKSFESYIQQNTKEIETLLARNDFYGQEGKERYLIENMYDKINPLDDKLSDAIKLYINENQDNMKKLYIDINVKGMTFKELRSLINNMGNEFECFNWVNNKSTKLNDKILKKSIQIIKTYIMGSEILKGNGISVYGGDEYLLLDIIDGKYGFNELLEIIEKYKNEFNYSKANTSLPNHINIDLFNEFIDSIV